MSWKGSRRFVLAVSLGAATAACSAVYDPRGFSDVVMNSPIVQMVDDTSEKAMAALTRGEYSSAERLAIGALRRNPKDPYALYVAGMVYQATGRYDLARQYYEVIIANRPQVTLTTPSQGGPQVRSLVDVAQANLLVVDRMLGRSSVGMAVRSGRTTELTPQQFEPQMPQVAARGAVAAEPLADFAAPRSMADMPAAAGRPNDGEGNLTRRFRTLKRLLDEGLITPDEFSRRRNVNLGALLPYSAKAPPAQGLERAAPTEEQVVDRLKALSVALESRALSPAEHSAERLAILDALLPAEPRKIDLPVLPPKDVMEGASAVGRVERMRAAGLVSAEEAKRERSAVEKVLDSQLAKQPVSGAGADLRRGAPAKGASSGGSNVGVSLGTAKGEEAARDTWTKIKAKFPEDLANIDAVFPSVDMGERGTRTRIVAGPFKSRADAVKLCKVLKLYRQSCEATSY